MTDLSFRRHATPWDAVYGQRRDVWGSTPLPVVVEAVALLKRHGAQVVLDCACGDGRNLLPLANEFPFVVGSDAAASALTLARDRLTADANGGNVILILDDACDSRFADESFDAVLSFELLSHLDNPESALGEMLRICRPGGYVIGDVFGAEDSTRNASMRSIGPNEFIYDDAFYFRYYTSSEATALATSMPAHVEAIRSVTWIDPPHGTYRPYPHKHQTWWFALRKPE